MAGPMKLPNFLWQSLFAGASRCTSPTRERSGGERVLFVDKMSRIPVEKDGGGRTGDSVHDVRIGRRINVFYRYLCIFIYSKM